MATSRGDDAAVKAAWLEAKRRETADALQRRRRLADEERPEPNSRAAWLDGRRRKDVEAAAKAAWLEAKRRESVDAMQRRRRLEAEHATETRFPGPAADSTKAEKERWLAAQRAEWDRSRQRRLTLDRAASPSLLLPDSGSGRRSRLRPSTPSSSADSPVSVEGREVEEPADGGGGGLIDLLRRLFSSIIVLGDDDRSWRLTPVGPCDAGPPGKPGGNLARPAAYRPCPFPAAYYDC